MSSKKSKGTETEKWLSPEEKIAKINEVRKMMGSIANKLPDLSSDASITRYLRARNWNTAKAGKMLIQTFKWRLEYKPYMIRWEDIANEGETGKIYRANYLDKYGRSVLVMRPGFQNTKAVSGQIRYLVYCMENAVVNLGPNQEQMVWLIDFNHWTSASTSIKATRETAHILQNHYPERLGLAILYDPPKIFESFSKMVKPFIEPKTYQKVQFVYSNNPESQKMMEETFDMNVLESAFGGKNAIGFDYEAYAQRMKEDDKETFRLVTADSSSPSNLSEPLVSEQGVEADHSDEGGSSSGEEILCSTSGLDDDKSHDQKHDRNKINSNMASTEEIRITC